MKPPEFKNVFFVANDTAYIVTERDGTISGLPRIGPLLAGQSVYLPDLTERTLLKDDRVLAWTEGFGIVSVPRKELVQR